MGLDGGERLLKIEEAFDISLEDEESLNVYTVGDCYDLILGKIGSRDNQNECNTVYNYIFNWEENND